MQAWTTRSFELDGNWLEAAYSSIVSHLLPCQHSPVSELEQANNFMRIQYVHVCLQFSLGEGIVNPPLNVNVLPAEHLPTKYRMLSSQHR